LEKTADFVVKSSSIVLNLIREFAKFDGKRYAASSQRVYLAAAKRALKALGPPAHQCHSCDELLALLTEKRTKGEIPKALRLAPFLDFVQSKTANATTVDLQPVRAWVVTNVERETKTAKQISYLIRRDLAMVAGLCLAPDKKSPRHWPRSALAVTKSGGGGFKVTLWGRVVGHEGLRLPLLYWNTWRERLARPDQGRLQRKERWAFSDLLFPNSRGTTLQRQVLHDALARMKARNQAPVDVTPALIRRAFLQILGEEQNNT
jgi:hypothetical protein